MRLHAYRSVVAVSEWEVIPALEATAGCKHDDGALPNTLPDVATLLQASSAPACARGVLAHRRFLRGAPADGAPLLLDRLTDALGVLVRERQWLASVGAQHAVSDVLIHHPGALTETTARNIVTHSVPQLRWAVTTLESGSGYHCDSVTGTLGLLTVSQAAAVATEDIAAALGDVLRVGGSALQFSCAVVQRLQASHPFVLPRDRAVVQSVWAYAASALPMGGQHIFVDSVFAVASAVITDAETARWALDKGAASSVAGLLSLSSTSSVVATLNGLVWPIPAVLKASWGS
jgi:hypothetical protein